MKKAKRYPCPWCKQTNRTGVWILPHGMDLATYSKIPAPRPSLTYKQVRCAHCDEDLTVSAKQKNLYLRWRFPNPRLVPE